MPRYARLLLPLCLATFIVGRIGQGQEQSSGYRLSGGEQEMASQVQPRPARITASLSDEPSDTAEAQEPSLAEETTPPAAEAALEAEDVESSPAPLPDYQTQYQQPAPRYEPMPYQPQPVPQAALQRGAPLRVASAAEPMPPSAAPVHDAAAEAAPLPLAPRSENVSRQLARPSLGGNFGPLGTVGASLAIVLSLFVAVVWVSRRLGPSGSAPLPKEALELLGRTPVGGQHSLQLVRFGGRLLLVALSPHGAATLTEVIDPAEVERLTAICLGQRSGSSSESFRQTIRDLEREPAGRSFVEQRRPAAGRTRTSSRA